MIREAVFLQRTAYPNISFAFDPPAPVRLKCDTRQVGQALTNVLRHAGPAHARVVVRYGAHDVTVEVSDDGRLRPARSANARGLIGLGERVRLYGGTLTAGPEGSQWVVRATLPLDGSALQ